jgi:hypothetical protein
VVRPDCARAGSDESLAALERAAAGEASSGRLPVWMCVAALTFLGVAAWCLALLAFAGMQRLGL